MLVLDRLYVNHAVIFFEAVVGGWLQGKSALAEAGRGDVLTKLSLAVLFRINLKAGVWAQ